MSSILEYLQRHRRPPTHLQDYMCCAITNPYSLSASSVPSGTSNPLKHYIAYDKFSPQYCAFLAAVTSHNEPKYRTKAVRDPHWCEAMAREISALEENHT